MKKLKAIIVDDEQGARDVLGSLLQMAKTPIDIRVAVTGASVNGVFRVTQMEEALAKNWSPDAISDIKVPEDGLLSDLHGAADYRSHLITVMAKRAVAATM